MHAGWIVLVAWIAGGAVCQAQSAVELVTEGAQLLRRGDADAARDRFERALEQARREGNGRAEGGAYHGFGKIAIHKADYPAARQALEVALQRFQTAADRLNTGRVLMDLGYVAWSTADRERSATLYREALTHFEAVGDLREQASTIYSLAFVLTPGEEQRAFLARGLDLSRRIGDKRLEGLLLHRSGDQLFIEGDLVRASENCERAAALLEEAQAPAELARVFTSLGRLQRAHGHPERAIDCYTRALALQRQVGDRHGILQSVDAIAIALQATRNLAEARARFEEALDLARATKTPAIIARQLSHLASLSVATKEYARAATLLDEAIALNPNATITQYRDLSDAYLGLSRNQEALAAAEKAVALASTDPAPRAEAIADALGARARVRERLGRTVDAIADARAAVRVIEGLRSRLLPTDDMRRDFIDPHRWRYSELIRLLYAAGLHAEGLEVAEQGRARAFLDLLATRDAERDAGAGQPAETRGVDRERAATQGPPAASSQAAGAALVMRGTGSIDVASLRKAWQHGDPDLSIAVSAASFSSAQVLAAASRLRSTVLAYWVGAEATYVWVATPGKPLHAARVEAGAEQLQGLILSPEGRSKGRTVATRGGDAIAVDDLPNADWRRLYDLLIRPVRHFLPSRAASRLTIVPHGPLLRLSFAALRDENGRYLLERYVLHYVPAAALLDFTARSKEATAGRPPSYLLVADPSGLPPAPDGRPLPRLPGARREVAAIARQVPAGSVTTLTGDDADEESVRARSPGRTVLHFATHAIIDDDEPFESYLALGGKGRLTAQEIYGLHLSADLVVLSACRSGLGRQSGDGIVGLTRAFFFAGAPSVVATLWDVADEPSARLVSDFYRALARDADKARALRTAQLNLLRALRRGEVRVTGPLGEITLPETPLFWAGFVMQGEF